MEEEQKYIHAIRVAVRLTESSELSQALYRPLSLRRNYIHHYMDPVS